MIEILLVFALAIGLGWPLGRYLAAVMRGEPMRGDGLFGPIERALYRLLGSRPQCGMSWRGYTRAFLLSNLAVGLLVWVLFMTQAWLPLNPDDIPNMSWDTALHTMVSFVTNTNQQHYSGQAQLSYLSQMVGIVGLQIVTPMMGIALVVATLRALMGGRQAMTAEAAVAASGADVGDADVGNYWVDVIRVTLRFMLPLCLLWSVLLASQGVPSTLAGGPTVTPLDTSTGISAQKIPLGPVAPLVAA
jgi:potassium-transporting ATPase potassium-binding subunit